MSSKNLFLCLLFLLVFFTSNLFAVPMVEVSVDIIEIKKTLTNNKGVEWNTSLQFEEGLNSSSYYNFQNADTTSGRTAATGIAAEAFKIGGVARVTPLLATLRLLISDNTARIIANPKLATESGSQANFQVGGEIPVPVASPQGTSIEWKTYGVTLQINPNIIAKEKKISAKIQVSISDLDYATAVKVSGYDIPGLLNRTASSTVTVDDGGTIVIAGLKQAKKENTFQRVPLLSSIPIIGWFFKSNSDTDTDTSMVIFVTFKTVENTNK